MNCSQLTQIRQAPQSSSLPCINVKNGYNKTSLIGTWQGSYGDATDMTAHVVHDLEERLNAFLSATFFHSGVVLNVKLAKFSV